MEIEYQTIYNYLHCGKCPAEMDACVNHKRATRNKATFVIKDGVLHYITKK